MWHAVKKLTDAILADIRLRAMLACGTESDNGIKTLWIRITQQRRTRDKGAFLQINIGGMKVGCGT